MVLREGAILRELEFFLELRSATVVLEDELDLGRAVAIVRDGLVPGFGRAAIDEGNVFGRFGGERRNGEGGDNAGDKNAFHRESSHGKPLDCERVGVAADVAEVMRARSGRCAAPLDRALGQLVECGSSDFTRARA
ncbi:MAG: hypothetical protein E6K53_01070 [Gammaproteobacteria bacterium]|nr:MAG: hypothetical protein E6K53_01070 [Gammaproteobacteria bacterium]